MGHSSKSAKNDTGSNNWKIFAAVIPIWGVVMFVGWFVISALVPMLGPDQTSQITNDHPEKAIIDFNTAAGGESKITPKNK